jgi:hypothetical protein
MEQAGSNWRGNADGGGNAKRRGIDTASLRKLPLSMDGQA